ncbi:putative glycoside hydrolase family 79 protein [Phaeomoniella chlamydospora]|uniref:Putative glycoside hydrolase family 79 protein n=1 Tax=Phaeomoniella chlamydospora TaxID=158046 RepID=A0A0G2EF11_PHACM|nr:putative glycoside hydrolase family 79 protein [Phaeomoniella chlamydospora]
MNITIAESRKLRAKVTFGSKWTEGFKQWPNVKWTLQIPFARKNATNGMIFAKGCVNAMDINTLQAIEIGNEPNFYAGPDRRRPYGPRQYAEEWKQYAGWVAGNITLPEGPMFQSMDIASGGNLSKWDVATMFDDYGLDEGAIIRSASYHYYQTTGGKPLRSTLLNHTDTEAKTNHFLPAIEYLNSTRDDSVHLIIGEAGSGLTNHRRDYNLEASLGTALWTVDWMLYCMSMNMTRVNMQLGVWFPFTAWTPIEYLGKPPHILGSFYGNLFIADFINKVGNLRVHQFKEAIPISEREKISAYAGYHHGELSKIVILNLEFWNQTVTEIIKSKDTDKPSSSSDKTTTTKTKTLPPPAQPDSSTSPSPPALSPI